MCPMGVEARLVRGSSSMKIENSPTAETKHDLCGISSADIQVASGVQETLRYEIVGLGVDLGVAQDGPMVSFKVRRIAHDAVGRKTGARTTYSQTH